MQYILLIVPSTLWTLVLIIFVTVIFIQITVYSLALLLLLVDRRHSEAAVPQRL